jgi:hypothetical protein
MTIATATKAARTLIAAATSNAAGATTRGTVDLRTAFGGLLTVKLTNGGTGPTLQAEARVLVAHNTGSTPTAAGAGADWKTIYVVGNGTSASTVGEWSIPIDQSVMHCEVEITGNTGQAVTCEAFLSELSSIANA